MHVKLDSFVLIVSGILGQVLAGKPELTLGLNTANRASPFGGLEPHATWSTGTALGDVAVDGGIDVKIEDVDEYPYNLWGRAQRTLAGWNLSARLEASSKNLQAVAFNLLAENELRSTALQVQGLTDTAQKSGAVQKLTLSQKLLGETLTLVPTYDFSTKEAEVGVTYSGFPNTIVNIDTSTKGPQMITVSQRIGEDNQIIPSVSSAGDLEIEYRRAIEGGTIAVNLKPKESVTLKWNDGPWLATLMAPMTGPYSFSRDINVGFKRSVQVF